MKKKLVALLLIVCMTACLAGCGSSGLDSSTKKEKARSEKEELSEDESEVHDSSEDKKTAEEKGRGFISDLKDLFRGDSGEAENGSEESESSGSAEDGCKDPENVRTDSEDDSYSISDVNDFEAANIILAAIQQGNMNAILELCAVDEFIDSKYTVMEAITFAGGNHPLEDYEYPEYSDMTRSMLHIMYEAAYSGSLFSGLFEMVNGSAEEDFMAQDMDNRYYHVSEQAVRFEEALEEFDFSKIQIDALAQMSIQTAVDDGWIDEGYASMIEILPMLKNFDAAGTYAGEGSVYVAAVSYEEKTYTVTIPLMHYEEGWRIQGAGPFTGMFRSIVINGTDGSVEETVSLLERYARCDHGTKYEPHIFPEKDMEAYPTEEDAAEAVFELLKSGNLADPDGGGTLQDLCFAKDYLAQADIYDWFDWKERQTPYNYNAVSNIGSYIRFASGLFPTAARGFSDLSEKILPSKGNVSAAFLWQRANMIALNLLRDSFDDYGITDPGYAEGWFNYMVSGDSDQTRPVGDLSAEMAQVYGENYPLNLPAVYQEKLEEVLAVLSDPADIKKLEDPIPENHVRTYQNMMGEFGAYRIDIDEDFIFNILIDECNGSYRFAGFDFYLEDTDSSGEPAMAVEENP